MAKSFFRKSVIVVIMVAFVSVCANAQSINIDSIVANAQRVVNDINSLDAQACGEYLLKNPQAVIQNKAIIRLDGAVIDRYVYWEDGAPTAFNDTLRDNIQVVSVKKQGEDVVVLSKHPSKKGEVLTDTTFYTKKGNSSEVDFATKEAFLRGEVDIRAPHRVDFDGNSRNRVQLSILGGGALTGGNVTPTATVRLGYETCFFLYEVEGGISSLKHTREAEYVGKYLSYTAQGNVGWKFWQDLRSRSYLAVLLSGGYGLCESDGDEAAARTRTYGFVADVMLRGSLGIGNHLKLIAEGGYKLFPELPHDQKQDLSRQGFFLNVGAGYTF